MIGKIIKDFKILRLIGEGGMNEIYLAENSYGLLKAIKTLKPHLISDAEARNRFKQECIILQHLSGHPNIIQIHDYCEQDDRLYLFLEYYQDGCNLNQLEYWNGTLIMNESFLLKLAKEILSALDYMHNHHPRIIHCDIKPSNIIVTKFGEIKLIDFGISQLYSGATPENITLPDLPDEEDKPLYTMEEFTCLFPSALSTPKKHFTPPEREFVPLALNERADIYMLGNLFKYLLRSRGFFHESSYLDQIIEEKLSHSSINSFIARATSRQPNDRFQRCKEIADFLQVKILKKMLNAPDFIECPNCTGIYKMDLPSIYKNDDEHNYKDDDEHNYNRYSFFPKEIEKLMNEVNIIIKIAKKVLEKFSKLYIHNCIHKKDFTHINEFLEGKCQITRVLSFPLGKNYLVLYIHENEKYYILQDLFESKPVLIGKQSFDYVSELKNVNNPPNACVDFVVVKVDGYYEPLNMPSGYMRDYKFKCL